MDKELNIQKLMEQHVMLSKIIRESNKITTDQGNLTVVQFYLLSKIKSQGAGFEAIEFAKKLGQNQSSISATISRMVGRGYLNSVFKNSDRRKHEFKLTYRGHNIYEAALKHVNSQMMKEHHLISEQLGINVD